MMEGSSSVDGGGAGGSTDLSASALDLSTRDAADAARREWESNQSRLPPPAPGTAGAGPSAGAGGATAAAAAAAGGGGSGGGLGGMLDFMAGGGSNGENAAGRRWVPDDEAAGCASCKREFDLYRRRHHCRHCGGVFCDDCSPHRLLLPVEFEERDPQRVCNTCAPSLQNMQADLIARKSNATRTNDIDTEGMRRYFNSPVSTTLGAEIRKAAYTTRNMVGSDVIKDKSIPLDLLQKAQGIAYLTVIKGGFIFAGRVGTGLVVAKLPDGRWSAPSAIGTIGVSWGALIGGDITDYMVLLNSWEAVEAFSGRGQISVGAELNVAVGPIGRAASGGAHVGDGGLAPAYSYSHSRGLFAGVSLEGALIAARPDVNMNFYGREVQPMELLRGDIEPPMAAEPLYTALNDAFSVATGDAAGSSSPGALDKMKDAFSNMMGNSDSNGAATTGTEATAMGGSAAPRGAASSSSATFRVGPQVLDADEDTTYGDV